jgi:hypothetical protein
MSTVPVGLDLVTTEEAARILGRSPQRIRQLANAGDLVVVARVGTKRNRLYARADVERLAYERGHFDDVHCAFCDVYLRNGAHEMHHFPVPERNGGTHTIPTCRGCHDKIDRYRLETWGATELFSAMSGLWENGDASQRILLAKLISLFTDAAAAVNKRQEAEAA